MKIVPNWKNGWKWLSVHLMVLGGAIQGAWVAFPDSMRSFLPDKYAHLAAMCVFGSAIAARFIDQSGKAAAPVTVEKDAS